MNRLLLIIFAESVRVFNYSDLKIRSYLINKSIDLINIVKKKWVNTAYFALIIIIVSVRESFIIIDIEI